MTSTKKLAVSEEFNERVSKKVKDVFLDLLPEDVFQDMVTQEVNAFFEEDVEFEITEGGSGGYGRPDIKSKIASKVSPFRLIVWEAVNKMVRDKVGDYLNSEELRVDVYHNEYGQQQVDQLNDFLDTKLEAIATRMAKSMFTDMFAAAVNVSKSEVNMEVNQALANRGY